LTGYSKERAKERVLHASVNMPTYQSKASITARIVFVALAWIILKPIKRR